MTEHPTCASCRWWDSSGRGVRADPPYVGLCRVKPPVRAWDRASLTHGGHELWPETSRSDWCGEHASRG